MNISQGIIPFSPAWHEARNGTLTSSTMSPIFTSGTGGRLIGEGGMSYVDKKIGEVLTGIISDEITGNIPADVERGLAGEPWAIERYEEITGYSVSESLLFQYNAIAAGTTDGEVVDNKGNIKHILEVKCPRPYKHTKILAIDASIELKSVDKTYWHQCQANLLFTESEHVDFISYCEDIKSYDLQVRIIRIYPDEAWRKEFVTRIGWIAEYMNEQIEKILKAPERNLTFRIEQEPPNIGKLREAINSIQNIKA